MKIYDTRIEMIRDLVPRGSKIAELGVFQGAFLKQLTETLNPSHIIGVDFFTGMMGSGDQDGNNYTTVSLDEVYTELCRYAAEVPTVAVIKGNSSDVLLTYPDDYFDMIYIDADHGYVGCKRDLVVSRLKVKPNGWIMGHDYEINMSKAKTAWEFGVKKAVDEFCGEFNQTIYAKGYDGCVSYAIQNIKENA
jgi:predicted O-methyltransferase YrrM